MDNKETKCNKNESEKQSPDISCCGGQNVPNCCESISGSGDCRSKMGECMKGFRWFPFIPVILGILLLLLGYYLDAEMTRILWMIVAGFVVLLGTFGLVMMTMISRKFNSLA